MVQSSKLVCNFINICFRKFVEIIYCPPKFCCYQHFLPKSSKFKHEVIAYHTNKICLFWKPNNMLFIRKSVSKGSGLEITKKLSNCLATLQHQFSKVASNCDLFLFRRQATIKLIWLIKAVAECFLQEAVKTFYLSKKHT